MQKISTLLKRASLYLTSVSLILFGSNFVVYASFTTSVVNLTCDRVTTPIGIDNPTPNFAWQMQSDVKGQKQTAYQIKVSTTQGGSNMWDSGKIMSDTSLAVSYGGTALTSKMRYFWSVDVWDKDGFKVSSEETWFETGLFNKSDWTANFIAANNSIPTIPNYSIDFDFTIDSNVAGVVFGATGTSNFLMWQINVDPVAAKNSVYFRPHKWTNGGPALIVEKDISNVMPLSTKNAQHHMKIVVDSSNLIITYIDNVEIDRRIDAFAKYGYFGFREVSNDEAAYFNNIVIMNTDTNTVCRNATVTNNKNPFAFGEIKNNQIFLKNTGLSLDLHGTPMFRKGFNISKTVKQARLYSTALGIYEAYINGQKVGIDKFAPGWTDYNVMVQYQTYDVTSMLTSGSNAVGAIVGNGWYSGNIGFEIDRKGRYGLENALLAQLEIQYTDGTSEIINSDTSWKVATDGPFSATDNQDGETYDANREIAGWDSGSFDDSNWSNAITATKSSIITKVDIANTKLVAQLQPVAVTGELSAVKITQPQTGVYVVDFGQNFAGWIRMNLKGTANETVRFRYGEMLYDQHATPTVPDPVGSNMVGMIYTENLRTAKATDYYTFKDGNPVTYEPRFTYHGFRYLEVTGYKSFTLDDVKGIVVGSVLPTSGSINSSDDMVNKLFSNINWGQRSNYFSVATDCPQRDERLGWTGDTQVFAKTASYNSDTYAFLRKFIKDIKVAQMENGSIIDVAPAQGISTYGNGSTGWGDVATIVPWTLYQMYGDKQILSENYDMMKKWVDYYTSTASNNIVSPGWTYGDWLAMEATPLDLVSTAFYAYSTQLLYKSATVLGKTSDAATYQTLYNNIKTAFMAKFVTANGVVGNGSQTSYVLALKFDLVPAGLRAAAAAKLVANIRSNGMHLSTGFLGVSYLNTVLSETGYSDIAYKLLMNQTYPSWMYPITNGATTMWERWNSYTTATGFGDVSMNSFNHYAYGSIGEWMYMSMAGIREGQDDVGFKKFILKPEITKELTFLNSHYDSAYGRIESNWTYNNSAFAYNATVPANTTATVYIPSDSIDKVTAPSDATFVRFENSYAIYTVASGSYSFASTVTPPEEQVVNTTSTKNFALGSSASTNSSPVLGGWGWDWDPKNAVNGNEFQSGSGWHSWYGDSIVWLQLDFGKAQQINKVVIFPRQDAVPADFFPKNFDVQVSLDGINWTTVITRNGYLNTDLSGKEFEFTPTNARYVKFNADRTTTNSQNVAVAQFEVWGAQFDTACAGNLAYNKTATASSVAASWAVSNAVDGDKTTTGGGWSTWGSNGTDLLNVDLGTSQPINKVVLYPRQGVPAPQFFPQNFDIKVSTDGANWTTVISKRNYINADSNGQSFTFPSTNARYVQFYIVDKIGVISDSNNVVLSEIEVYNSIDAVTSNSAPQDLSYSNDIALGKPVTSSDSSVNNSGNLTNGILDDYVTRETPHIGWNLTVDLQAVTDIKTIKVRRGTMVDSFAVSVSSDGTNWTLLGDTYMYNDGTTKDVYITPSQVQNARYVNIYTADQNYNEKFDEVSVYNTPSFVQIVAADGVTPISGDNFGTTVEGKLIISSSKLQTGTVALCLYDINNKPVDVKLINNQTFLQGKSICDFSLSNTNLTAKKLKATIFNNLNQIMPLANVVLYTKP